MRDFINFSYLRVHLQNFINASELQYLDLDDQSYLCMKKLNQKLGRHSLLSSLIIDATPIKMNKEMSISTPCKSSLKTFQRNAKMLDQCSKN